MDPVYGLYGPSMMLYGPSVWTVWTQCMDPVYGFYGPSITLYGPSEILLVFFV